MTRTETRSHFGTVGTDDCREFAALILFFVTVGVVYVNSHDLRQPQSCLWLGFTWSELKSPHSLNLTSRS
jgi:hypothetical protein